MSKSNNSETSDTEITILDDQDRGSRCCLRRLDQSEVVEAPKRGKSKPVDLKHCIQIRILFANDKMLWCGNRLVEAEAHQRQIDVVGESGRFPRLLRRAGERRREDGWRSCEPQFLDTRCNESTSSADNAQQCVINGCVPRSRLCSRPAATKRYSTWPGPTLKNSMRRIY